MSYSEFNKEIKRLFDIALDETFSASDANRVGLRERSDEKYSEFFVLTISSQTFRVLLFIHLNNDERSRRFVAKATNQAGDNISEERFYDYMGELGNTLCGSIKRNLNRFVPSLGMSTPNRLNHESMNYMNTQNPDSEIHESIHFEGTELFVCSAYICADTEPDFDIPATSMTIETEEDTESGELEFF